MAIQTSPHTQTRQNLSDLASDLDPNQLPQELVHGDDAELYANTAGAQSGGTRSFSANDTPSNIPRVLQADAALTGSVSTRTPESDRQGITNRSASEESARQRKVVSQRPDAQAGVDQVGHRIR